MLTFDMPARKVLSVSMRSSRTKALLEVDGPIGIAIRHVLQHIITSSTDSELETFLLILYHVRGIFTRVILRWTDGKKEPISLPI